MPMTRSELIYFAAGVAVGAAARSTYPILKEKFGPLIAGAMASAGAAVSDSYADVARRVEAVQEAVAEMKSGAAHNGPAENSASAA